MLRSTEGVASSNWLVGSHHTPLLVSLRFSKRDLAAVWVEMTPIIRISYLFFFAPATDLCLLKRKRWLLYPCWCSTGLTHGVELKHTYCHVLYVLSSFLNIYCSSTLFMNLYSQQVNCVLCTAWDGLTSSQGFSWSASSEGRLLLVLETQLAPNV